MDERIYSKNIIEFVTVSAEYCAFIERHREYVRERSGKHRKSIGGRRQLSGSFSKRYEIQ